MKNKGLKPLDTAKQTCGIKRKFKRKPSGKERNKRNRRQLRCSGSVESILRAGGQPEVATPTSGRASGWMWTLDLAITPLL